MYRFLEHNVKLIKSNASFQKYWFVIGGISHLATSESLSSDGRVPKNAVEYKHHFNQLLSIILWL